MSLRLSTDIFKLRKSSCKLPDPRGPLSRLVTSLSIVSANKKVQSVLESKECTQTGRKGQRYSKRTEGQNQQVLKLPDCWAMGVVNLQLEVGGASKAWQFSKIKSRKV